MMRISSGRRPFVYCSRQSSAMSFKPFIFLAAMLCATSVGAHLPSLPIVNFVEIPAVKGLCFAD